MENEVSIITWINGWREANGLSADEALTEEQAKSFLAGFKENFSFTSDNGANVLVFGENADPDKIAELTGKYDEGTVSVISELDEVKLIDSDDLRNAVAAAVGEEWFDRIYNGETVGEVTTGKSFEDQLAVRDFVYSEIVKNSSASEMVALVADDADDSLWNRTLLNETFLNEKIETINKASIDYIISMGAFGIDNLGYSAERASQVTSEYVRALSTAYTDNSIIAKNTDEFEKEYIDRVMKEGHIERYAFLFNYISDVNSLKTDIIYYLKQYGDSVSEVKKAELLSIAGVQEEKLEQLFKGYDICLGDDYTYSNSMIKELVNEQIANIAIDDNVIDNNEADTVIITDTPDLPDNSDQPFEEVNTDNNENINSAIGNVSGNVSNGPANTSSVSGNTSSSSGNTASSSGITIGGSTSNTSGVFIGGSYSGGTVSTGTSGLSGYTSNSSSTVSSNKQTTTAAEKLGQSLSDFSENVNDANNAITAYSAGVDGALEGVRSYGLLKQDDALQALLREHKPGAMDIYNRADEFRFRSQYENGQALMEGSDIIGKVGDGLTVVCFATETASHVINACTGAESPRHAAWEIVKSTAANVTSIAVTEAAKPVMTFTIIPAIESVCAGVFGTTGAAAVAAPALLTAAAVIDIAFIGNWLGDCAKDLLDGDGEFHPFKIWVDDAEGIGEWFYDLFHSDDMEGDYNSAGRARYVVDPLIFDLDNDGFNIIDKSEGAYFDKDNNGYRERIDWTKNDAFLTLDRNNNGRIDNGSELFGDTTYINGGDGYAENGFAALQQYDENGDGVIDSNDSVFGDLRLWVDANGDGVSQESELTTLAHHSITSISAVADEERLSTGTDAVIDGTSTFEYADGSKGRFGALWATANYYDSKDDSEVTGEGINIGHLGNMPSLASALANDDGTLQGYIDAFNNAVNYNDKMESLDNILFTMSGAQNIASNSRGSNIDARRLHVIETIMGEDFSGVNGANPNPTAANILKNMYNNIANKYYTILNIDTVRPYIEKLVPYENENGEQKYYTGIMCVAVMNELNQNPDSTILADVCKFLSVFGINGETDYDVLVDINSFFSYDRKTSSAVNKEFASQNIYIGTYSGDKINGSGNADTIYGGAGDDKLYGGSGNDELHGGAGNDYLNGGSDNDTYIFELGDENDTINEERDSGTDKVVFGEGITTDDVVVTRDGNDMVLLVGSNGDTLRITSQFTDRYNRIESFEFADGTVKTMADYYAETLTMNVSGEYVDPDDYATGVTVINASDKDDIIKGNGRRDVIYGGAGDDKLYGGSGNDELHGGAGNDYLNGGSDNDTYIFELGDGNDTINEERDSGTDKVVFGKGITTDDVVVTRDGNDMVLLVGSNGDTLRITSQFTDRYNRIESFEFADGTVKTMDDYYAETLTMNVSGEYADPDDYATGVTVINASDEDDIIKGNGRRDVIYGGAGDDKLYGGSGNDELHGGAGNDYLNGGSDNDTYIFELGDGNDTINEERDSGTDKVVFGEGITAENVVVTRDGNDMVLLVGSNGDTLRITSQFTDRYNRIESFEFADGTVKTMADYYAETLTMNVSGEYVDPDDYATGVTVINASDEDDIIKGNGRRDVIYGGAGDDKLYGGSGNDELHGGAGNDYLNGGSDNDTYIFELGDGNDTINEERDSGTDKVVFGEGITAENVVVTRDGNDMVLLVGSNGDTLRITSQFTDRYNRIESFEFADGTVKTMADYYAETLTMNVSGEYVDPDDYATGVTVINASDEDDIIKGNGRRDVIYGGAGDDKLYGGSGNDELHGGAGNDYLNGGSDNDTYIFELGDGNDTINEERDSGTDKVVFGEGITAENVVVTRDGNDMVLLVGSNGDTLRITSQFTDRYNRIESFEFADGTVKTMADYYAETLTMNVSGEYVDPDDYATGVTVINASDKDDIIKGNGRRDVIYGGAGDDKLYGGSGNDELHGGAGNDYLNGGSDNDTYIFELGDGNDTINEERDSGTDKVVFGKGITTDDVVVTRDGNDMVLLVGSNGDTLRITSQFTDRYNRIESFEFADGTVKTMDDYYAETLTMNVSGEYADPDDYATGVTVINASDEDDIIKGNGRRDVIYGGAGDDKLYGGSGNDELHGGAGNDYLNGGSDNDTYIFELGDGNDTINEERDSGTDKVVFGEGITAENVVVTRDGNDMVLLVGSNGDTLRITSQFTDRYNRIESFEFADGTVKTMADYYAETLTMNVSGEYVDPDDYATGVTVINASDKDDIIKGNGRRDVIYGGAGDDKLYGGSGNDELHGGAGNDYLNGGSDNDTYIFELGDGNDTINEERDSGTDKVVFGKGITTDDVVVTRDGNDMVLLVGSNGDTLRITSQFTDRYNRIESFEFADGTVKTMDDYYAETLTMNVSGEYADPDDYATGVTVINASDKDDIIKGNGRRDVIYGGAGDDKLYGGSGNDELHGGAGSDYLNGGSDNDTYIFELGDGNDTINEERDSGTDKVVFGEGITLADVVINRDENDAVLSVGSDGDSLRVVSQFTDRYNRIESFEFADGTIAHIDLATSEFVIDVEGTSVTVEETLTEYLSNMYSDEMFSGELTADNTVIADVTESASVGNDEIADMTDIQTMILTENMSAFSNDSQISNGINIGDITSDSSALDQLLISSSVQ